MSKIIVFILRNPLTLLLSVIIGVYIGSVHTEVGLYLSVYSTGYLLLLNMTVIPVIISAVICSIGKFITNEYLKKFFGKIIFLVLIISIVYSLLGIIVGLVFSPGNLSQESKNVLSEQINLQGEVVEINLSSDTVEKSRFFDFILKIIPSNIFNSLSSSHIFSLLIFSVLFGLSISSLPKMRKRQKYLIIGFFEEIYEVFSKLIFHLITFLPIFLVCIIASEFSKMNADVIAAISKLILIFYIFGFIFLGINTIILAISLKKSIFSSVVISFHLLMATFAIRNSIVVLPMFVDTLTSKFKVNYIFSKTVMPILTVIGRFGNIFYFSLITIFSAQLYNIELEFMIYLFLAVIVVVAGFATFGISGIPILSIITVVISIIGIPVETTLLFLVAIDMIIEPLRVTLTMHMNAVLTRVLYSDFVKKYQNTSERVEEK